MTFEVEVGSRARSVTVTRGDRPDHYTVTIDGRSIEVRARRTDDSGVTAVRIDFAQQGRADAADKMNGGNEFWNRPASRQVYLTPAGAAGEILATFEGRTAAVTLNGRRGRQASVTAAHAHGDHSVRAPMPGRVVRVLVAAGDEVAAGQGVVVVEAMKMENELRAPKTGRVRDVNVSSGASVDAGKVLVVIE